MKLYLETVSHSCPVPRDKEVEDVVLTVWNVEAHDRLVPLLRQRDTPQLLLAQKSVPVVVEPTYLDASGVEVEYETLVLSGGASVDFAEPSPRALRRCGQEIPKMK